MEREGYSQPQHSKRNRSFHFFMHAVIVSPVANVQKEPKLSSSLEHQVLFGENLHIVCGQEGYYSVRTFAEQYPGWIKKEDCFLTNKVYMGDVIVAEKTISLYVSRKKIISLCAGTYLERRGKDGHYLGVRLPDDGYGLVDPEAVVYGVKPQKRESIVSTAKELSMWEIPYLWGGVSPHGIDCSGLMKLILRLNGITAFPRDSRQQYVAGGGDIDDIRFLSPGDMIFFTAPEKEPFVTHVGMMVDPTHFVHASKRKHESTRGKNCIAVSSLTNDPLFGNYYAQYFVGGTRHFHEEER